MESEVGHLKLTSCHEPRLAQYSNKKDPFQASPSPSFPEETLTLRVCKPNYSQRPADPERGLDAGHYEAGTFF